jgi:hypothetical protein
VIGILIFVFFIKKKLLWVGAWDWGLGRRLGFEFGDLELLQRRETGSETSHLSRSRDLGIKTWMGLGPQKLDRWFGQYSRDPRCNGDET